MQWGDPWLLGGIALLSFALSFVGASVGLVLGHLRLPLLVLHLGGPAAGAACNLIVSGTGALAGAANHVRNGRVSLRCLALMGIPSAVGAVLGAVLFSRHLSHFWAHLVIGAMLVVSGLQMLRPSANAEEGPPAALGWRQVLLEVLIGLGLGVLAVLTGLMLGSLRLPLMMRMLRIDAKVAVGSNLAIGCLTALVGATTWFATGRNVPWGPVLAALLVVVPPTMVGGYLGGWLTGRISKEGVKKLAGVLIAVTGLLMVGQEARPLVRFVVWPLEYETPDLLEDEDTDDYSVEDDAFEMWGPP